MPLLPSKFFCDIDEPSINMSSDIHESYDRMAVYHKLT